MELKTRKGESFFIDEADYDKIKHITWRLSSKGYVVGYYKATKGKVLLHRLILDAPSDKMIDHKDRNPINNKRENLRLCTCSENHKNKKAHGGSKYLGVTVHTTKVSHNTKKFGLKTYISKPRIIAKIVKNIQTLKKFLGYLKQKLRLQWLMTLWQEFITGSSLI